MSEEEKEAIESLRGKEISIEINWTPKQKATFEKAVGIKEFRENCIKVDILIKLIEKLQKELDKKDKVIKQLEEDISNMYDEKVVRNILEDECGLSKFEIDAIESHSALFT
jgi:excinuclease UvrABC nuclease subunit